HEGASFVKIFTFRVNLTARERCFNPDPLYSPPFWMARESQSSRLYTVPRGPMSIKSDRWIRRMAHERAMIDPFVERQVRELDAKGRRVISYGVSSYGYDLRVAPEFKIFTNVLS